MSDENVCSLLRSLGLENLIPVFRDNAIDDDLITELTDQDLAELGLKLGHRKRFQKLVGEVGTLPKSAVLAEEQPPHSSGDLSTWERQPGERKNISLLFADITGSTALTESLDSEDAHDLLYGATRIMCESVENNRGHVARFMGDGLMAMFGVPMATEHHARDACLAALEIQKRITRYVKKLSQETELQVRIGVNSGKVVVLTVGDGDKTEFDASGPDVALTARMEQSASPGSIQITASTKAQASGLIRTRELPAVSVKGFTDPVSVWELTGLDVSMTGYPSDWQTTFVGRQMELAQFKSVVANCLESSEGHIIYVRGQAGIGKTRLLDEFSKTAQDQGMNYCRALILDFGAARGQETIPTLVAALLGAVGPLGLAEKQKVISSAISIGRIDADQVMYFQDLMGIPLDRQHKTRFDSLDNITRQRGRELAVASLVRSSCLEQPLLISVEDVHWADPVTLNFLAEIGAGISELPAIMLMTSRVEGDRLDEGWRGRVSATGFLTLDLAPLKSGEASALAADIAHSDGTFVQQCIERSEGNPLFLEQLLRTEPSLQDDNLPDSIQTLVQSRMDRLPERDRTAIQAASVAGQRFTQDLVRFLIQDESYECGALLAHQLVRVEGGEFLFAHALIREGVYHSLLGKNRRRLHSRAADWFQPLDSALYAEHLDLAGDEGSADAYIVAAREFSEAYRYSKALSLTERAIEISKRPEDRQPMFCFKAETLLELGQADKSMETFEQAIEQATSDVQRCLAQIGLASAMRILTRYEDALELLELAQPLAEANNMDQAQSILHHLRGNLMFPLGKTDLCRKGHKLALHYAEKINSPPDITRALGGMGDAAYATGHMQSAYDYFSRCIELCREFELGKVQAAYNAMVPYTIFYLLRYSDALPLAQEAVESACALGHLRAEMNARSAFCHIAYDMADIDPGVYEQHATRSVELAIRLGAKAWKPLGLLWVAICHYRCQRYDLADEAISEAVEIGRDFKFNSGRVYGVQAYITRDSDIRESALDAGERIIDCGTISHNVLWFNRYAMDAMLETRELDRARYYADRLEQYTSEEHLPWAQFFISRTRVLAEWYENPKDQECKQKVKDFVDYAHDLGLDYPVRHLKAELDA